MIDAIKSCGSKNGLVPLIVLDDAHCLFSDKFDPQICEITTWSTKHRQTLITKKLSNISMKTKDIMLMMKIIKKN